MNVSYSKMPPSSKSMHTPPETASMWGRWEYPLKVNRPPRAKRGHKQEASDFPLPGFLVISFFSRNTLYYSHPLLSDHPWFCNQRIELAEPKWLGSCRDETQLNKQILKWCLDERTWTGFRFFFKFISMCDWILLITLSAEYYIFSSLLYNNVKDGK